MPCRRRGPCPFPGRCHRARRVARTRAQLSVEPSKERERERERDGPGCGVEVRAVVMALAGAGARPHLIKVCPGIGHLRNSVARHALGCYLPLRSSRAPTWPVLARIHGSSLAPSPSSDRCRGLAGEDQCQGWRLRHRVSDAPLGAPLTVIFARREDARRGGWPGQMTQERSSGTPLRPEPPACGCGPADRRAAPRP